MVSDSTRAFVEKLREAYRAGQSMEGIAAKIAAAEPETAEFRIRALVEIALECSCRSGVDKNA
jgi:hypothetical protein